MNVLDTSLVIASLLAAIWWMVARRRGSKALDILSFAALGLAAITLAFEGRPWQLVPWQIVALVVAAAAGLRRWRPEVSHRWSRVPGRIVLFVGILAGGLGMLTARVPSLPEPSGPLQVGSVVYRWTDPQRPEIFTLETEDRRQVVAQAWYPSASTEGPPVPYFEAQGRLPALIDSLPWFFFDGFGAVNTHARTSPAVAAERATWPVLLFLPGWGTPREQYTALCTDLASRGYVVVALSHPYESAVSLLDDGRVVGQAVQASMLGTSMAQVAGIRAADSSFVLDQLNQLMQTEPRSPLAGRLDLGHVGIVGHSLGGASAAQVIANDSRFQVGVNIDGTLHDALATARLDRPFLWLQSDGAPEEHYVQVRDALLGGLRAGGDLVVVGGSSHGSFTDLSTYWSPAGRLLLGEGDAQAGAVTSIAGDIIDGFVAPRLGGSNDASFEQALARHPSAGLARRVASAVGRRDE